MTVVYAVSMNKGGVGKTTLVTNLAGALFKKHKKKVLIIDTDGQGNSAMAFGIKNPHTNLKYTIYDIIMGNKKPEQVVINLHKGTLNKARLDIIPANNQMNFLEFDILPNLKKYPNPFHLLKDAVGEFVKQYDYVFIDTPPSLSLVQGNVLSLADRVIIPFHPEPYGDIGLISVIEVINDFKSKENPQLQIAGIACMKVESVNAVHEDMLQVIRRYCHEKQIPIFDTIVPKRTRFVQSVAYEGKPSTMTRQRKNDDIQVYFQLLNELLTK